MWRRDVCLCAVFNPMYTGDTGYISFQVRQRLPYRGPRGFTPTLFTHAFAFFIYVIPIVPGLGRVKSRITKDEVGDDVTR